MVGVIVEDMPRAIEFYRRLGVEFAEGSENKTHVEVNMGDLTFFLNTKEHNKRWDPAKTDASGGYRIILEFYLETPEVLQAKYNEMIGYGYTSHVAPYKPRADLHFAMIDDPDGNTILLSAFEKE
jgi:catechol 2,3-dioxygenase-like lactoylglutathione lyase family enzyme